VRVMAVRQPAPAAARPLAAEERPDPRPGPGELVIEVAACGVCRTDLQIAEGDLEARVLPIVPGHQVAGRVVAVGAGVEGWAIGDRAGVAWLGHTCGRCRFCTSGRENLCPEARFTGWDRDGGYAERIVVEAGFALALPEGFADLDAAPLLCGGVIGYRSLKVSGIEPGGALGLYGFGASALLALQVAVHWGCDVYVVTRSATERDRARGLGARWAGGVGDAPPVALDAAVTFAPVGSLVVEALSALAPGATVAINAIHLDGVPAFSYDLLWRERSLRSVANFTRADATEFLALAAAIPVVTAVESHPLAEANVALGRVADSRVAGAAVLVP
jgi:alcohol dehydrogenase, propanol-preferring